MMKQVLDFVNPPSLSVMHSRVKYIFSTGLNRVQRSKTQSRILVWPGFVPMVLEKPKVQF